MASKRATGRQKIEMKLIESKEARQVTFSKRRSGLFKKGSELCILTGCEITLVFFSPSGKPFSFGHPNVDTIVQRFLCQGPMEAAGDPDPRGSICPTLHHQYIELCKQLEAGKARSKELDMEGLKCEKPSWFDTPTRELSLDQLEESKKRFEELRDKIAERFNELFLMGSTLRLAPADNVGAMDLNVALPEIDLNVALLGEL